ncbi:MAG: transposase, partial [Spirochaetia bacterium]|nr:transposase [Spirochaetia bacterium]
MRQDRRIGNVAHHGPAFGSHRGHDDQKRPDRHTGIGRDAKSVTTSIGIVVERKSAADFVQSVIDGRLFMPAARIKINKRPNVAYVLKECFGQLWDYNSETWARKFFENWKKSLKWQRLKPYEKFCGLIE